MAEFSYKSQLKWQERIINIVEMVQASSKTLLWTFIILLVLAIPLTVVVKIGFARLLVSNYQPPPIISIPIQAKDLLVIGKNFFSVGADSYSAYARVSNPNIDLALRQLSYDFSFLNSSGKVVSQVRSTTYILPGQDKIILISPQHITETPRNVEVKLTPQRWSRFLTMQNLDFLFEQVQFGKQDKSFYVSALLKNSTPYFIPEVEVTVLLYNIKREVIGVNYTTVNALQYRESRFFKLLWPNGMNVEVANVEFKAVVNQLQQGSYLTEGASLEEYYNYQR